MKYFYKAPVRIDLAGGTLDLWPISILLKNPVTVNAAIDLFAETELRVRDDRKVMITSKDQNITLVYESSARIAGDESLPLIKRIIEYYNPGFGFDLKINCRAPIGSGLGGSSALNIAVNKVFIKATNKIFKSEKHLVHTARNLETGILRKPTGVQDYYPSILGGVLKIKYSADDEDVAAVNVESAFIEEHISLCYTGVSRLSIENNWEVYKSFLDNRDGVPEFLQRIAEASNLVSEALENSSLEMLAKGIKFEWENRKKLFKGIETRDMMNIISASESNGALACKACGAGGGGCMIVLHDPEDTYKIRNAIKNSGGVVLDYRLSGKPEIVSIE